MSPFPSWRGRHVPGAPSGRTLQDLLPSSTPLDTSWGRKARAVAPRHREICAENAIEFINGVLTEIDHEVKREDPQSFRVSFSDVDFPVPCDSFSLDETLCTLKTEFDKQSSTTDAQETIPPKPEEDPKGKLDLKIVVKSIHHKSQCEEESMYIACGDSSQCISLADRTLPPKRRLEITYELLEWTVERRYEEGVVDVDA